MATLLTCDEVADRLKVSLTTAYRLLKTGAIESIKVCRQWRVSEDSLNAYLAQQTGASK